MNRKLWTAALCAALAASAAGEASAFCGFYVAKADASLYNKASQVVLARDGNRSVISMMNDYEGEPKDFAMVVPVPVVLKKGQIHVGDKKLFDRIDAYSAPRLVEYFDEDPCVLRREFKMSRAMSAPAAVRGERAKRSAASLGVTVEAEYTIGEYDIVILSAKESDGLETWLIQEGYRIPKGAHAALEPYIRQNQKFFVARVNLKEHAKAGLSYLRPLQFAFESEKFMLPVRLGMINAKGPQELLIYVLSKSGRVETTNYRTVMLPTGMDLPTYVKGEFKEFYRAMFDRQVAQAQERAVFTEYFWDMGWCDPCAADPLSQQELKSLGVFWLAESGAPDAVPAPGMQMRRTAPPFPGGGGGAQPVMVTRLHLRYRDENFPQDLMFQQTADRKNFQGRYVLRHAWNGNPKQCEAAGQYFTQLAERRRGEAQSLASLTGWKLEEISAKMAKDAPRGLGVPGKEPGAQGNDWWEGMWEK